MNRIRGVMISMLASNVVYRWFDPQSGQTRVITKLPNTEQSSKGKTHVNKQTKSVNNRKTQLYIYCQE
jgi:hypothetical protein